MPHTKREEPEGVRWTQVISGQTDFVTADNIVTAYEIDAAEAQDIIPESPDCAEDTLPPTEPSLGKKTLRLPDLVSMWKYMLCKAYADKRVELYSFLNDHLRRGHLSEIVGFPILNKVINRDACELVGATFWQIDRENFYADVQLRLTLKTSGGQKLWNGILVCWCSFDETFSMSVESLEETVDRDGYTMLSPFLVPYMTNKEMDAFANQIWRDYGMEEAICNPDHRQAKELAKRMGLTIEYHDVYEHQNMDSIIFFEDSDLTVGEDRIKRHPDGSEEIIKTGCPTVVRIHANTIVINTNKIRRDYSAFNIFHECIHYQLHYMFFRLQKMGSNDIRLVKVVEKEVEEGKKLSDPIFFMENQANRGAYALMMPAEDTAERFRNELDTVKDYKNRGHKFEIAGKALSSRLHLPHFRVKPRLVQLGFIEIKGALNYIERKLITPFGFHADAWKENEVTFVIKPGTVYGLERSSEEFRKVMATGKFVYADGHVVRNDPRFVTEKNHVMFLTEEAAAHVDDCCLRFVRRYVQENVGSYVLGRMFYDSHLVEQTHFYISDIMNEKQMDDLDAKQEYRDTFPRKFAEAFDLIMEKNDESRETVAYRLHTSEDSLSRWFADPVRFVTPDFIIRISLMWQLPDWISQMLLARASILLSEFDRRQRALEYIRTVMWDQGIEEANKYLESRGLERLDVYETEKTEGRKRKRRMK